MCSLKSTLFFLTSFLHKLILTDLMHTFKENKQINKQEILNQAEIMLICKNNENEE